MKQMGTGLLIWQVMLAACTGARAAKPRLEPVNHAVEMLDEMNRLRTNPHGYIKVLEGYKRHFRGNKLYMPGEVTLMTQEGAEAVEDAIRFLKTAPRLHPLKLSAGMSRAAADHVVDLGPRGQFGHFGSDGSSPSARIERHGTWKEAVGESLAFGEERPSRVVLQLLIDDGVPDRGHRKKMFDPRFRVVGIACGEHATYRQMCVIDFAAGFQERR